MADKPLWPTPKPPHASNEGMMLKAVEDRRRDDTVIARFAGEALRDDDYFDFRRLGGVD